MKFQKKTNLRDKQEFIFLKFIRQKIDRKLKLTYINSFRLDILSIKNFLKQW